MYRPGHTSMFGRDQASLYSDLSHGLTREIIGGKCYLILTKYRFCELKVQPVEYCCNMYQ
ncbi:MAG: hypothetical protein MHMPM18_001844 [Marteilia pararefringens]